VAAMDARGLASRLKAEAFDRQMRQEHQGVCVGAVSGRDGRVRFGRQGPPGQRQKHSTAKRAKNTKGCG
jgi:hypothetical protein